MVKRLLLGPQRPVRNLGDAVDAAGFGSERIAVISAGWQEAEGDIDDVRELVRRPLHDLGLYRRADEVFAADPGLHAAYRRRQDRLQELQRLYQVRLRQLLLAARRTLQASGEPELVAPETRHAVSQLRALDRHHLNRVMALYEEFDAEFSSHSSDLIAAHAAEIERELAGHETLLITGGNLVVLLNRLRLFGVQRLLSGCNLIAWSAGAMLLADLIVLFHDRAAQGRRDPEVLGPGCCVIPDYVFLPDASRRLRLKDDVRVDLFSRRFAPSTCVTLDSGSAVLFEGDSLVSSGEARRLAQGGRVRKSPPDPADIEAFIASTEFPLVDGRDVTFVFRGTADEVYLRCWIAGLDTAQPLQSLPGTDLWAATIDLPEGSRVEYKFEVIRSGHRELVLDPLNKVIAHDPFGANSVCQGAGYRRPAWTTHDPDARAGKIEIRRFDSKVFGGAREIQVYLPARFRRNRRYPLLVVHDGIDYLRYANLKTVLDNLMQQLDIPEMIVAMTQSPDRLNEYAGDDRHAEFIAKELVSYVAEQFPVTDDPRSRGLMGASFGGVASLHAAWRYPEVFGCLLLQSGSFAFSDLGRHRRGKVFDPVVRFINEFREVPGCPAEKIYMSCGIYESLIYENRSMVPKLQQQGIDVRFEEARDAHNWENWRDRLRNGLSWLFPGPVWIVYE